MIKISTLIILAILSSGCSWISRDYYYKSDVSVTGWTDEFRKGKRAIKRGGYPDAVIYSYKTDHFKLTLEVSYQDVVIVGPLLFPVIPTPWKSSRDLYLSVKIYPNKPMEFDSSKWKIIDGSTNEIFHPVSYRSIMDNNFLADQVPKKLKIDSTIFMSVTFPIKAVEVSSLTVNLGAFFVGAEEFVLSILTLSKAKGDWHFDQLSI